MRAPLIAVPRWALYSDAAAAAEDMLGALGTPLEKASPFSNAGYNALVRSLLAKMAKSTVPADAARLKKAAAILDQNWEKLEAAKRAKVIGAASKAIGTASPVMVAKVTKELASGLAEVVVLSKKATGGRFELPRRIVPSFNKTDKAIVDHAASSQGNFITDQHGKQAEQFSKRARIIVAKGLDTGLGSKEIGKALYREALEPTARQSRAYYETVARIHTARARTYGALTQFEEAEFESFRYLAILDEVTTDMCRFLNGQTFSVARAVQRFRDVEQSDDPEAVRTIQPWLQKGKDQDGNPILFAKKGDQRIHVCNIRASGEGEKDKIGRYSKAKSSGDLEKLGISTPPSHANCRSDFVPV